MSLNLASLDTLPTDQVGAAVHAELRRTGHEIDLEGRKLKIRPAVRRDHQLHPWLHDVHVFTQLRCARCSAQQPRTGLNLAYWGEWLCEACRTELGRPGGELDQRGWPEPNRSDAA